MSDTPIPRSLALTYFGEFDVSIIDEMPAGRLPIQTKIVTPGELTKLKARFLQKLDDGQKLFVVTPLIEESEHMEDLKAVTQAYQETRQRLGQDVSIAMIHGKMKPSEKDHIMADFKSGTYSVLVATTVIEVGVDIPEATMMIIHNAERFGLSQLHQLRGRIGRNDLQSYCFLEMKRRSGDSFQRLKAMEETSDGFRLAEIDLQYRGA
jgi:ATP-dependent DNA helicase RecG